jgi:uncharacterized protein
LDARTGPPIELLILQSTPFCNIDCSYCYLSGRSDRARMSEQVIAAACERAAASGRLGKKLSIVWHAGEPLVLPVAYYERARDVARWALPASTRVEHHFQTNGTLLGEEWCEFLQRDDVRVGVSVDGPRALHDRHRRTRKGAGTFDRTIAGIRRLVESGLDFHVISVLTRDSLFFPDEMHDFYVEHGIRNVCFNIEEIEGINRTSTLSDQRCEALYARFFERFLERAGESGFISSVRELDQAFGALLKPKGGPPLRNQQAEPFLIVSVAANGDYTTFSPELLGMSDDRWGNFVLGNVLTHSFADVESSEKYRALTAEIARGVERCRATCGYFAVCGGGAPSNKLYETGSFDATETLCCRYTIKLMTEVALRSIEQGIAAGPGAKARA